MSDKFHNFSSCCYRYLFISFYLFEIKYRKEFKVLSTSVTLESQSWLCVNSLAIHDIFSQFTTFYLENPSQSILVNFM